MELSRQSMHNRKLWTPKQAQQDAVDIKSMHSRKMSTPKCAQQGVMHAIHLALGCQAWPSAKEVTCGGLHNLADLPLAAADQKL